MIAFNSTPVFAALMLGFLVAVGVHLNQNEESSQVRRMLTHIRDPKTTEQELHAQPPSSSNKTFPQG
jgi:hypothetical protein